MVIIITGASHTGKTALAQRVLEKYHIPYLFIDHIKMGLIRSGNTQLTPLSSDYVKLHFQEIKKYADIAEKRLDDSGYTMETALEENRRILEQCRDCGEEYILIADKYQVDIDL